MTTLEQLRSELRLLNLPSALAFINHLLAVSRGDRRDPKLETLLKTSEVPVPEFLCQFLAKHVILNSSIVGPLAMDFSKYRRLAGMYFDLEDPIISQPGWKSADPTAFFERFGGMQLPSQQLIPFREYGLALALFRDSGVCPNSGFDIRAECERVLGMTVEQFMQFGFMCMASMTGAHQPLTFDYFVKAYTLGFKFSIPEVWSSFLRRVASTPEQFRDVCFRPEYRVDDERYVPSEFNPLLRHPLIEIKAGHFLAPDPMLLVARTTWGLFYDLFERYGGSFTKRFGDVFGSLVGQLLRSVYPGIAIWSDDGDRQTGPPGRRGDWAYKGKSRTVLIECKSLRPNINLMALASEASVADAARRVAEALDQLGEHDAAIQRGDWSGQGLSPGPTVHVVVTYGRFSTINGPFFRKRIEAQLKGKKAVAPYVVLSIQELDCVIRLVELGRHIDDLALEMAKDESFDVLHKYHAEVAKMAVSTFSAERARGFLDGIAPTIIAERDPLRAVR
jgi:hypothetical protein